MEICEQKFITFSAQFPKAYQNYEKTTGPKISCIFHKILLVFFCFFFALKLDHLLKVTTTLISAIFGQVWGFFRKTYHLQEIQKNFQINSSGFESGLKYLVFTIFEKSSLAKLTHIGRKETSYPILRHVNRIFGTWEPWIV